MIKYLSIILILIKIFIINQKILSKNKKRKKVKQCEDEKH